MTRFRNSLLLPFLTLALAACADKPVSPTEPVAQAARKTEPARQPKIKEPARQVAPGQISSISITDLFSLQQSEQVLLFDARPSFFYKIGHLPGAISLPKAGCVDQITKRESEIKAALAAKKTIVVYCTNTSCPDARTIANHLSSFGYPSSILIGGWDYWKESGLPTE